VTAPWPASPTASEVSAISGSSTTPGTYSVISLDKPGSNTISFVTGSGGGSVIDPKWVTKYPHLFGPGAKDPDEGQGEIECTDSIAQVLNKFTGIGGTFSTWSERHCFITAASIGYTDVEHTEDVPPVPEFWIPEGHYWVSGIAMGRAARKVEQATPDLKTIAGIFAAGGISIGAVLKFVFPMIGIA